METEYSNTIILGASFLGIGCALVLDGCIVIESSGIFGAEFLNTYKVNNPGHVSVKTKPGIAFLDELRTRKLVSENGQIYQAPAIYVLSKFLKEKHIDIRLMTEVIKIEKEGKIYRLTLYNINGFKTVNTKRIIDTTSLGKGHTKAQMMMNQKYINAIIHNPTNSSMEGLSYNNASGMYTYSLAVPFNSSRFDAIEKLCSLEDIFRKKNMKISSIAPDFFYTMPESGELCTAGPGFGKKIDDDFYWHPSIGQANLVAAFDEGCSLGEA